MAELDKRIYVAVSYDGEVIPATTLELILTEVEQNYGGRLQSVCIEAYEPYGTARLASRWGLVWNTQDGNTVEYTIYYRELIDGAEKA